MTERKGIVARQGQPLTLVGPALQVGDRAPDVTLLDNELQPVSLSEFRGRNVVLSVVPSLDTPTCDRQTRRFNAEAERLGPDVPVLTISMDLPFAQKRWCGAAGVKNVRTLSDHRDAAFGTAYGLLIRELRLLARAVLVLDREAVIRHIQIVPELSAEPDYAAALAALAKLR